VGHHVGRGPRQSPERLPGLAKPFDIKQPLVALKAFFHPGISRAQVTATICSIEPGAFGVDTADPVHEFGQVVRERD
jgi:hypothetical protein